MDLLVVDLQTQRSELLLLYIPAWNTFPTVWQAWRGNCPAFCCFLPGTALALIKWIQARWFSHTYIFLTVHCSTPVSSL